MNELDYLKLHDEAKFESWDVQDALAKSLRKVIIERDEARSKLAEYDAQDKERVAAYNEKISSVEAKLAEYERWQGEAEKAGQSLLVDMALNHSAEKRRPLILSALTAAHARGYAAGVEAEREECAKDVIAEIDGPIGTSDQYKNGVNDGISFAAVAIRNRSGQ